MQRRRRWRPPRGPRGRARTYPLPPPRALGLTPDPAAWAAHLEGPLAALEAALRRVHRDRRERETTLVAKHEAIRRFDRTQSAVTGLLAALYRLAELNVFEERLRPKRGRPRRKGVEAAQEAAGRGVMALVAAEGGRPDRREPVRTVADEPARELEPFAAAADGPGAVAAFPATAARSSNDFSGPSAPVADEGKGFFEPSATACLRPCPASRPPMRPDDFGDRRMRGGLRHPGGGDVKRLTASQPR